MRYPDLESGVQVLILRLTDNVISFVLTPRYLRDGKALTEYQLEVCWLCSKQRRAWQLPTVETLLMGRQSSDKVCHYDWAGSII